jgi:hypothetical protein
MWDGMNNKTDTFFDPFGTSNKIDDDSDAMSITEISCGK